MLHKEMTTEGLERLLEQRKREMLKAVRPNEIIESIRRYNDACGEYSTHLRRKYK